MSEEELPTVVEYSENRGFVPRVNNITESFKHGDELVRRKDVPKAVEKILKNLEKEENLPPQWAIKVHEETKRRFKQE